MPISIKLAKLCADFGLTPYGVRYALEQYQKVIVELTDGKLGKLTYPAELICDTARDCFEKDQLPDAVPVVRCKDCIYRGAVQCALATEYNQYRPGVDLDWFCAKGRRPKNEAD